MRAPGTRQSTYTHVHYTRERISAPPRWTRDPNAKVNGRVCSCVQVVHPVPRRNFRFHLARVFIDDELLIQGTLCLVRAGFCRGLLVQGPRRLSLLQRPPDGSDGCASR